MCCGTPWGPRPDSGTGRPGTAASSKWSYVLRQRISRPGIVRHDKPFLPGLNPEASVVPEARPTIGVLVHDEPLARLGTF